MWTKAFFQENGIPKTSLSPLVDIYRASDNTKVINSANASEIGGGFYKYNFSTYDHSEDYAVIFDSQTLTGSERYAIGEIGYVKYGISKNVAFNNFEFVMIDSTNSVSPKTGLTVTAQISKDGGAFANCSNSVSEVGNGVYKINLTQNEMNANVITLKFTASGANQSTVTLVTSS